MIAFLLNEILSATYLADESLGRSPAFHRLALQGLGFDTKLLLGLKPRVSAG